MGSFALLSFHSTFDIKQVASFLKYLKQMKRKKENEAQLRNLLFVFVLVL